MTTIEELAAYGRRLGCSDLHLTPGLDPVYRKNGILVGGPFQCSADETEKIIRSTLDARARNELKTGDADFCWVSSEGYRHRVNIFREQGRFSAAIRFLSDEIPTLKSLGLPPVLEDLTSKPRGLVLITGPTGSGKSTTLAAMIGYINSHFRKHIIAVENPVEYLHPHNMCIVHQREVGRDTPSFAEALRSALREDPDVILVGEMRDRETIAAALTAAETGHLVLSTLHTVGAAETVDRIVDAFPAEGQNQIKSQLASVLEGVVTQTLVPLLGEDGRTAATEILIGTESVRSKIREGMTHQIITDIQTGGNLGMHTLNADLARLVSEKKITWDAAQEKVTDQKEFVQYFE